MGDKLRYLIFLYLFFILNVTNIYPQEFSISDIQIRQGVDQYCNIPSGTDRSLYTDPIGARIEFEKPIASYPGGCLSLCATLQCVVQSTPTSFGIDDLSFEIFKFGQGANPLDPSSTQC